jgi:hypothetical protein
VWLPRLRAGAFYYERLSDRGIVRLANGPHYIFSPIVSLPETLHHKAVDRMALCRLKQELNWERQCDLCLKETKHRIGKDISPPPARNCSMS